jgi:hypothetical protein
MRARQARYVTPALAERAGTVEHGLRLALVVSAHHAGARVEHRGGMSAAAAESTAQLLAQQGYQVRVSLEVAA